jgi:hypothetical protein
LCVQAFWALGRSSPFGAQFIRLKRPDGGAGGGSGAGAAKAAVISASHWARRCAGRNEAKTVSGTSSSSSARRVPRATEVIPASSRGVKLGRKPKLTDHQKREAIKRREQGDIARSFNVSQATISRLSS